ncbi:unnamed protein product [Eruca vesicaria subsp. sativa]|uniref:AT-hook motif nuclear-localized protein n=1 Tax=Eruca vesicaria subsp. sativa TaxID=29727 RepID=A0ABC8J9T1_ERUVS|nr:unnamed protein product [Eruca vesicaria subsp. sativa]
METSDRISSGVTVMGVEAPSTFHMAPRLSESPNQFIGSSLSPMGAPMASVGSGEPLEKKKRGRPRKYEANGATNLPVQISSSAPLVMKKRGRGKLNGLDMKMHKRIGFHTSGERFGGGVGSNFTPHIITVNAGEDINMRVISFSQQGPRAICILSANGVISNVTLRHPDSCGGTLTYEGRFEILSLSGTFTETENQGSRGRSGGMSVSLAGPDGRVVGGGVAGLLIAATPIQVVVGSFVTGDQQEHKKPPRKQRVEHTTSSTVMALPPPPPPPASVFSSSNTDREQPLPSSFDISSWTNGHDNPRSSDTDINVSLPAH